MINTNLATETQRAPSGMGTPIVELVKQDLDSRAVVGEAKYGERLRANNGRDALVDAYQEVLDLAKYLRQEIEERRQFKAEIEMLRECNAQLVASEQAIRNEANRLRVELNREKHEGREF